MGTSRAASSPILSGGSKQWARKESCSSQIRKLFKFEAAHTLPYHPGKCARMHGHSYRLEVTVQGLLQTRGPARGMVQDFDRIDRIVSERVLDALDHQYLNDLIENPTVENIVLWIWKRLEKRLLRLEELVLWETATACAILRRSDIVGTLLP